MASAIFSVLPRVFIVFSNKARARVSEPPGAAATGSLIQGSIQRASGAVNKISLDARARAAAAVKPRMEVESAERYLIDIVRAGVKAGLRTRSCV
jgi:hypothetical protein